MNSLFDKNIDLMSRSLDLYLLRHNVITDNIANAETPNFKSRKIEFESQLQRAIESESQGFDSAINDVVPVIYEDIESESGQDRNTVDMDREMAQLSKNDVKYSAASQAIQKKFAFLKYAISEGAKE